jgi:hypothetical protein
MKLVVPHTGELKRADARIIRLAHFMGISCVPFSLDKSVQQHAAFIEKAIPDRGSCFVVNPQVIREWTGDVLPADFISCLLSRFPFLLVHSLTMDSFGNDMIATLSGGRLQSVHAIATAGQPYEIASNAREVCGAFSGLSFGQINSDNDRVFSVTASAPTVRKLISIGGSPFMAGVKQDKTEILFLAGADLLDLNHEIGYAPLSGYFSRLMPHAMALRYIFGEECWHPGNPHASITIDDPLLWPDYGYLNFENLLRLTEEHNFHATIAFIPHNYRRNSARIIQMFRENPRRFSICFHGNDHTEAELASTDTTRLNTMLGIAEERMKAHEQATGLYCHKVMVFPSHDFSVEALEVLKSRNFHAAMTSRPHPLGQPAPLRIADLAQPALLRFGGFPLFVRSYPKGTQNQDIAFNLFFGRPLLVVGHHETFKQPSSLLKAIRRINSVAPGISWSNLENAVDNAILKRRMPDGTVQVRAYSSKVRITNDSDSLERLSIVWGPPGERSPYEQALRDGTRFPDVKVDDAGIRVFAELAPGASETFSVVYRNDHATLRKLGFRWDAKAFLRRRLSEMRDNYLSKNQQVLTAAETLRGRFLD